MSFRALHRPSVSLATTQTSSTLSTCLRRSRRIAPASRAFGTALGSHQAASSFTPHTMPASATSGPLERTITSKVTSSLQPTYLSIHNDSHLHAHHAAMKGNTSPETHFRVTVVSAAFEGKTQPARHRMVYNLLKEEMAQQGGLHALQLVTRTPKELAQKEKEVNARIDAEERERMKKEADADVLS